MNYQWFPGHMTKAFRMMQEDIKLIDLVIELLDARAPLASGNPDIDTLAAGKARMILLNKADLADEKLNEKWISYFSEKGLTVVLINSRDGNGIKKILPAVQEACREKLERDRKRAGRAAAKTGNKPGVTKGKQWIRLNKNIELLDTPGVLWPKFEDQDTGRRLAFLGSINDEIIDKRELACELIDFMKDEGNGYAGLINSKYGVSEDNVDHQVISDIAMVRKCLIKGGEPDIDRASGMFIDDFRSGKLGRITLERP